MGGTYVIEVRHDDNTAGKRGNDAYDAASYITSLIIMQPQAPADPRAAGREAELSTHRARDHVAYFTASSSTSKISVALGGMTPPAPRAP